MAKVLLSNLELIFNISFMFSIRINLPTEGIRKLANKTQIIFRLQNTKLKQKTV